MQGKTRKDYELEMPRSIKDMLVDEFHSTNYEDWEKTGRAEKISDKIINELMDRVFSRIEHEALKQYKSNEFWAVKAWCYEHILKDATAKEVAAADDTLLDELMQPMQEWQRGEFDPLLNFRRKLQFSGRKEVYINEVLRVAVMLVSKYGKKKRYTEIELLEFLDYLKKRYWKFDEKGNQTVLTSSYVTKVQQLKTFLDSLPEDERGGRQKLPMVLPSFPDKFHQPSFTNEEIEALCLAAVLDEKPESVLRLAIATIYGCRVGELAKLTSDSINLDHDSPTIDIPTEKKGRRAPQPIPTELIPLFSVPLKLRKSYLIQRDLRRICRKAGIKIIQPRTGIHSIRRSVVTTLYSNTDLKEIHIQRFMRWAEGGRGLGVMPRYIKTPTEVTDAEVLSKHPYMAIWRDLVKLLPCLPQYQHLNVQFSTIIAG